MSSTSNTLSGGALRKAGNVAFGLSLLANLLFGHGVDPVHWVSACVLGTVSRHQVSFLRCFDGVIVWGDLLLLIGRKPDLAPTLK